MVDFRALEGTADFYFLRHGESEGNRERVMQGRRDSLLTETGREQAREAGQWFAGRHVDCVLTSPLARARDTAELVAAAAGFPRPESNDDLTEIDTGTFTGLTMAQARARHPEAWRTFQLLSWEGVPDAERIGELYARAMRLWATLLDRRRAGASAVLCVTHSGTLQWIIKATVGHRQWMPLFSASENCCVSQLHVESHDVDGGGRGLTASWLLLNLPVARSSRT